MKYFAVKLSLLIGHEETNEVCRMSFDNRTEWLNKNRDRLRELVLQEYPTENIVHDELLATTHSFDYLYRGIFE